MEELRPGDYVNATRLAKKSGKEWKHYHSAATTKRFLSGLARRLQKQVGDLVVYKCMRNTERCTWVHPDIGADLQRWIQRNERQRSREGRVYLVTSDVLNAVKIGSWSGTLDNLRMRYTTPYGPTTTVETVWVEDRLKMEAHLHNRFEDHNLGGELFDKAHYEKYASALNEVGTRV